MLHTSYPLLTRIAVCLVLPAVLALIAGYFYLARSLPQQEGTLAIAGLHAPVRVLRDARAVPHIVAATDRDAFFALGYLHAQERMWQMEFQRRLGQGRLSEILGSTKLPNDQYMRTLGLYRAAKLAVQSLDEAARQTLEAYVAGINTWIKEDHVLPPEYHVLGFEPEPWKLEDSLLQMKLLALDLEFNFRQELMFDVLVKHMGVQRAIDLMPSYAAAQVATSAQRPAVDAATAAGLLALGDSLASHRLGLGGGRLGSNVWAVSGKFTQSGSPMLANDPHLAAVIPSVWYLAELRGDRLKVAGATYPGSPLVVLGRNDAIAWGASALGADVQDLYLERINPSNEDEYEVEGRWVPMEVDEEWIRVKSEFPSFLTDPVPPLKWRVRRTRHGPLISDAMERANTPLALRWTALDADDRSFQSLLAVNYAQSWDGFLAALRNYVAPTLNFVYADKGGTIGYIGAGRIPVRKAGDGKLPVAGWTSAYEWGEYLALDALPQGVDPEQGYIVNSNNVNHGPDYPHLISNSWAPPYRADSISEALQKQIASKQPLTPQDFSAIQGDVRSVQARQLLAFIRSLKPETPQQQRALERLEKWDGTVLADSVPAALYQSWFRHFSRLVVNDELIGDLLRPERFDTLQLFAEQLNPVFIERVLSGGSSGTHDWCDRTDTEQRETCAQMALAAIDRAIDELISVSGDYRPWGEIHKVHFEHRGFTEIQLLDYLFDRVRASGGDDFTINVGGWTYSKEKGYRQAASASYRQVIDLSDWSRSGFVNNTGQSGNVLSRHYDDNIAPHQRLELLPMHLDETSPQVRLLQLEPAAAPAREASR